MRAAVVGDAGALVVSELPDPEPGPGQALVKVAACGVCGSDLLLLGKRMVQPGTILGHEIGGVVEALGAEVIDAPAGVGDAVAVAPALPCGSCARCAEGTPELCPTGIAGTLGLGARPGGLAGYVVAEPVQLAPLRAGLPAQAGALAQPLAIALHGVERGKVGAGERVVVVGGGSVGLLAALALRTTGVEGIVISQRPGARRSALERLGFEVVDPDAVVERAGDADVVLECSGTGAGLSQAIAVVRPGGRVVVLGLETEPVPVVPAFWVWKQLTLLGAFGYGTSFGAAVAALEGGEVPIDELTAHTASLDEVADLRQLVASAPTPKVLVDPWLGGQTPRSQPGGSHSGHARPR
jgi:threonine dehydrogenase-like Zn-dependent dehydrogenase